MTWAERHIRAFGNLRHQCLVDDCPGRESPLYVEDILHPPVPGRAVDFVFPDARAQAVTLPKLPDSWAGRSDHIHL